MEDNDRRIAQFCSSPDGCAFLLTVERNSLSPAEVVTPDNAYTVAAYTVDAVRPWQANHAEVVGHLLSQGPRLFDLARSLLSQPEAADWFAPLDREAQMWIGVEGRPLALDKFRPPAAVPTTWERYAQKSAAGLYTSTIVGDLCSWLIAIRDGAGDAGEYRSQLPYTRYQLRIAAHARVFEVTGPADWHALCTTYPAHEPNGRVVPDWTSVASAWDGVHLTLGGLLTSEQVRVDEGSRWSMHDAWDAEQTLWLRNRFVRAERWPDLADELPVRDDIAPWWYWGPTWNDDPKPWRTQLWAIEADSGDDDANGWAAPVLPPQPRLALQAMVVPRRHF